MQGLKVAKTMEFLCVLIQSYCISLFSQNFKDSRAKNSVQHSFDPTCVHVIVRGNQKTFSQHTCAQSRKYLVLSAWQELSIKIRQIVFMYPTEHCAS